MITAVAHVAADVENERYYTCCIACWPGLLSAHTLPTHSAAVHNVMGRLLVVLIAVVRPVIVVREPSFRIECSRLSFLSGQHKVVLGSLGNLLHPRLFIGIGEGSHKERAIAFHILALGTEATRHTEQGKAGLGAANTPLPTEHTQHKHTPSWAGGRS